MKTQRPQQARLECFINSGTIVVLLDTKQNMNESKPATFHLRLPLDLKKWVEEQAAENDRSINKELVRILRKVREEAEEETN